MPAYGVTPAGFVVPPTAVILQQMQQQIWDEIDPQLDLSPQTADGQILGIIANGYASLWEIAQIAYNQFNREDAEGASLDNIGDITGSPRETESFTQVICTLTIDAAHAPYAAGSLTANVENEPSQTYTNLYPVTAAQISGGIATGVLFQSTIGGQVPFVNDNTLNTITSSVTGWTAINNPGSGTQTQTQTGTNEETDAKYMLRQVEELAAEGTCNPAACAAAIQKLGAAQAPPIALTVSVLTNTSAFQQTIQGVVLPPHSFQVVIYEADGLGWIAGAGGPLIGQVIWENTPSGISSYGPNPQQITDPTLGVQTVYYNTPQAEPIFISATIVPAPTYKGTFAQLTAAVQSALVAAAVAATPANGNPPVGQLAPGTPVVQAQLKAVMMSVPGVFDVPTLTFDFVSSPTNTAPLLLSANQVATILASTVATNVVLTQGAYP